MADCARFMRRAAAAKLPSAATMAKTANWSRVRESIYSDYLNEIFKTITIFPNARVSHLAPHQSTQPVLRIHMTDTRTAPYAALLLRLSLAAAFLAHAGLKIFVFTPAGTAGFFQSIGLP